MKRILGTATSILALAIFAVCFSVSASAQSWQGGYNTTPNMNYRSPMPSRQFNLTCNNVGSCFNNNGSGQYNIGPSAGNFNNGSGFSNGRGRGWGQQTTWVPPGHRYGYMPMMRQPRIVYNLTCNNVGSCFNNNGSGQYNIGGSAGNFNNGSGFGGQGRH